MKERTIATRGDNMEIPARIVPQPALPGRTHPGEAEGLVDGGARMTRRLSATLALTIAASCSSAMGAYHFFLPSMFHWGAFLKKVPQPIPWALFAINFFFSFLLLAGGILTFITLRALRRSSHSDRGILFAMAGFWLSNTLYQIFIPMPLPARMWPLHVVLLGFAAVTTLAYAVSLLAMRKAREAENGDPA